MINLESSHSKATTTKSSQWPAWLASVAAILILLIGGYTWMKNRFEHGARLQQLSIHEEQDPLSPNNSKQVSANWENNPEKRLTNKWFAFFTSVNASNPKSLTLLGVNFESDSTTLSKQSDLPVYDLAEALQAFPNIRIRIDDITDSTGGSSNNRKLSLARAMAVRAKLEQLGIEASRLEVKGFGELNPVATHKEGERSTSNPGLVVTVISEELPLAH